MLATDSILEADRKKRRRKIKKITSRRKSTKLVRPI